MWKVFTHDYRSPIQGGEPVWDGTLPFTLPKVELDTSEEECGAGWNFCADMSTALRIGGLWPTGSPSLIVKIEPLGHYIERSNKIRAEQLRLVRLATDEEIRTGIEVLSEPFGEHQQRMVASQLAWRAALGRPDRQPDHIPVLLQEALAARGMGDWTVREYPSAQETWAAWDTWDARDAWDTWDAWNARDAWVAGYAWAAAGYACDAWAAWDAGRALTWEYAALRSWPDNDPLKLTVGIRAAYRHGLLAAYPTERDTLGWVMAEEGGNHDNA